MLARRKHGGGELAQRGLGGRLHDQIRLADQPFEREGPMTPRRGRIAYRDAGQRDAGDAFRDGLGDMSADHAHADDADLDHDAPRLILVRTPLPARPGPSGPASGNAATGPG